MASFSWHRESYEKAVKQIATFAAKLLEENPDWDILGWTDWFKKTHPEQFKKYDNAMTQINKLWGSMEPKAMEEFKKAVKVEVDATKWAVTQYIEHQKKSAKENELKGEQKRLL